jgi:hypothetical protein
MVLPKVVVKYLLLLSIVACLLNVFTNCSSTKEHTNYKLAKKPIPLQRPTLVRTDGVYVHAFNYRDIKSYRFIRFYDNGRCFVSESLDGVINSDSLASTSKTIGIKTFFRNKENNITYEDWGGSYTGYCYNYGFVTNDSLIITSFRPRGISAVVQKLPEPEIYLFRYLSTTNAADW